MSAAEKSLKTLGILAGGGLLPRAVIEACIAQNIKPFIVAFKGSAEPEIVQGHNHVWASLPKGGAIIKELKKHHIVDIVFIGSLKRPNPLSMMPDMKTAKFLAAHSLKLGDNSLLIAIRKFFEKEGFKVHGAHQIAPNLLTPEGTLGKIEPSNDDWNDIKLGLKLSQDLGHRDLGQSVIVKNGELIAEEGTHGTDAMIEHYGCEGAILVKTCKPQQDPDLDMPTIGPQTIQRCAEKKMRGVVAHADKSLFMGRTEAIKMADDNGIFIIGAKP